MVADKAVDTPAGEQLGGVRRVDGPREDERHPRAKLGDDRRREQPAVDRDAVQRAVGEQASDRPELGAVSDRTHQPDVRPALKGRQVPPVPGAQRHLHVRMALERREQRASEARMEPLEVEHEPGGGRRGLKQRLEIDDRGTGTAQPPPVPIDADRADRLQMADLEPAAEEVDVGLDHIDAERLGGPQCGQVVTRAMREDERAVQTDGVGGRRDHEVQCRRASLAGSNASPPGAHP